MGANPAPRCCAPRSDLTPFQLAARHRRGWLARTDLDRVRLARTGSWYFTVKNDGGSPDTVTAHVVCMPGSGPP
jgi:hypothetical protein